MNVSTDQLFTAARTAYHYLPEPVPDATLHELYELLKWGPTSANSCPARFIFVRSAEAKEKLVAAMSPGNQDKTRQAPVAVIVGMDMAFYEQLPRLMPTADARSWFVGNPPLIEATALRNSSLQAAYLILAARSLGLDCGPMSGFDAAKVDAAFWSGTTVKTNLVVNLGHGDPARLHPRNPRPSFDEVCSVA